MPSDSRNGCHKICQCDLCGRSRPRARRGAAAWIRAASWLLAGVFAFAAGAQAQGVRYDNIVLGPRGTPVAAATIAVCTSAAVRTTTPCSPLAQIYSDQALTQPMANPFQADSLGNYGFWAQPGHYVVQIYGTGVTTRAMDVFLACDPSNCTMTSATFSSITAGTLNLTGSLTVNGRGVATEPMASDAVQYVSPNGNDSSSGLSWGSAKQTIYAAWNALAAIDGGAPNNNGGFGGVIYVAQGSSCGGPTSGQGLQIMGPLDANWNSGSVPSGWVKQMDVRLVGVSPNYYSLNNSPAPGVQVDCGSGSSANLPALWISGTDVPMEFDNLVFYNPSSAAYQALRMGIDSSGVAANDGGAVNLTFRNDAFYASTSASGGPTVDIGANSFNDHFYDDIVQTDTATTGGTDQHQAIVINSGTESGCNLSGLIRFRNLHLNGGGIKYYAGLCNADGSLYVNGLVTEDQNDGHGAVWITKLNGSTYIDLKNITVADASVTTPPLEVDSYTQQSPDGVVLQNAYTCLPSTFEGYRDYAYPSVEPSACGQSGFLYGKVWGQTDAARRLFGPVESRYANQANFLPSSWSGTTETAVTDPTGTDFAGQSTGQPYFYDSSTTVTAGDFIVAGGWYRVPSRTGVQYAGTPFQLAFLSGGCQMQPVDKSIASSAGQNIYGEGESGDGQWTWASGAFVVTTGGTCELRFQAYMENATTGVIFYSPTLYVIPHATVSSYSEAADIAQTLAPYPHGLTNQSDSTLPGHPISFGGSGDDYLATLDHTTLTSNQTYTLPTAGGTVGVVVGETTVAGPTTAIASGACASTVTASVSGVTTNMTILATPNADPAAANYKNLTVYWFPTAGNVNLEVCNPSASSVTPSPLTFNVRAIE